MAMPSDPPAEPFADEPSAPFAQPFLDPENLRPNLFRRLKPVAIGAAVAIVAASWWLGHAGPAIAMGATITLAIGFALGLSALRIILSASHPIVAVARAIVEESVGSRLSVVLVTLVLVSLPVLPLVLDPSERLAYRTQFFLDWSLAGVSVLLSILTIALCCSSVCGDIDRRHIHMTLAKPVRRWDYLFGKWLGVILLDAMLVVLAGAGIFVFAMAIGKSTAADEADRRAVDEQVLTARIAARPVHPRREEFEKAVAVAVNAIREDDPTLFDKDPDRARKRILSQYVHAWHMVTADVVSSYVFEHLDRDRIRAPVIQLRLEPFSNNSATSESEVRFALWLNERPYPVRDGVHEEYELPANRIHTIELPTSAIAEDGTLRLAIANRNRVMPGDEVPTVISFNPGEGLEILYRAGTFTGNFIKGLLILWAKLAMLAAISVAAASWLGLPVAMLVGLMVFATAVGSAFVADAIDIYTGLDLAEPTFSSMLQLRGGLLLERIFKFEWWEAIKTLGAYLADLFLLLVPSFGDYDSITQLATGRLIPVRELAAALVELGLIYPAVSLVIGWLLLENRDLMSSPS